jgi:hypothetical protein
MHLFDEEVFLKHQMEIEQICNHADSMMAASATYLQAAFEQQRVIPSTPHTYYHQMQKCGRAASSLLTRFATTRDAAVELYKRTSLCFDGFERDVDLQDASHWFSTIYPTGVSPECEIEVKIATVIQRVNHATVVLSGRFNWDVDLMRLDACVTGRPVDIVYPFWCIDPAARPDIVAVEAAAVGMIELHIPLNDTDGLGRRHVCKLDVDAIERELRWLSGYMMSRARHTPVVIQQKLESKLFAFAQMRIALGGDDPSHNHPM